MAQPDLTPQLALLEEAVTLLFCRVDDIYYRLNPKGRSYETLKGLSDSEVITRALFQQLRGVESERSFLREVGRFFSHLFPGAVGLHPSSLHRRVRNLRRYFEPLRRAILGELVGEPETLIVDSTLLAVLHPREVSQSGGWGSSSAGAAWVRQQIEIAICSLKRTFGLGETLATTLVGLATRIAAKITAYTYAFLVNRMMGRPQGRIKELWA